MNKKRLVLSIIVLCLIILGIFMLVKTLNKDNSETDNNNQQNEVSFKEYTTKEWKEYASNFYENTTGNKPGSIKLFTDNSDVMIIEIYENENSEFIQRYNLNYKTGKGTDLQGNQVDLELK